MRVSIVKDGQAWRGKLALCAMYDFYHTWDFHVVSRNNHEGSPVMFVAEEGDCGLLLPLLERKIPDTDMLDLTSVYGYPSPLVYGMGDDSHKIKALWCAILDFLRESGYVSLFARGHPMLTPEVLRGDYYKPVGDIVYLDCYMSEEDQLRKYRRNHRQNIRKLKEIGVRCIRGKGWHFVDEFERIYAKTMISLGAKSYYLFSDEYYKRLLGADDFEAQVWIADWNGKAVATGLLIFCNKFTQYHLSGTDPDYYKLAPSKLLIDEARRAAKERGTRYLIIGGGYKNRSDNLMRFKKGFSDKTGSFSVAKIILDEAAYCDLVGNRESGFFPIYREEELEGSSA